jgi:hypothetical protein
MNYMLIPIGGLALVLFVALATHWRAGSFDQSELRDTYEFTGFFMVVSAGATPGPQEDGNFPK